MTIFAVTGCAFALLAAALWIAGMLA